MIPAPTRHFYPLVLLLFLGFLVTGCSTPTQTGRYSVTLITQQNHLLEARQTLVGDTFLAGGTLTIEEGA